MLYIEKQSPPAQMMRKVSEIKSTPLWKQLKNGDTNGIRDAFEQLPKNEIRQALLEEQHYLCAYCMRRLSSGEDGSVTIEHWYPLSKDKDRALDYKNMHAVCDGGRKWIGEGKRVLCCDASKADTEEMKITPLNKQQMASISYTKDGFLRVNLGDTEFQRDIDEKLMLNGIWEEGKFVADTSTGVVMGRKTAYESYEKLMRKLKSKGQCTSGKIGKLIKNIEEKEHRPEFAGVVLYFLRKKYNNLVARGL